MNKIQIENTLMELGVPVKNKGFAYMTDYLLILEEQEKRDKNLPVISMYREIAKRNDTTGARVERCIRHTLEVVRTKNSGLDKIQHFIGFDDTTNANSMKMLYLRMKNDEEEQTEPEAENEEMMRKIIRKEIREVLWELLTEKVIA